MSLLAGVNPFRYRRSSRLGRFTEIFVLAILICIFVAIALDRIWKLRVAAEQAEVMQMEGAIRSALGFALAEKVASGKYQQLIAFDGANPMDLLEQNRLPGSYLGALPNADPATIPGYHWYFDSTTRNLVYRIGNPEYFHTDLPGPARVLFRVKVQFEDRDRNAHFDVGEPITGIDLWSSRPYQWTTP